MHYANRLIFKRPLPESTGEPLVQIDRLTAIDLGTNSVHALIVDIYSDGSFRVIDMLKEQVGFGAQGMNRMLPAESIDRALEALQKIKLLSERRETVHTVAYATSAVRESVNGGAFLERVLHETGIKVLAIPGLKEAELIHLAVKRAIHIGSEPVLIMDIGGGSTEFILTDESRVLFMDSYKLGGSRTYAAFITTDPVSKDERIRLRTYYKDQLKRLLAVCATAKPVKMIVSSGTMESVANIIQQRRGNNMPAISNGFTFSYEELNALYRDLTSFSREQRLKLPGIDEKRIDAIVTGVTLAQLIAKKLGISQVVFSSYALREGMVIEHIHRLFQHEIQPGEFIDIRHQSVYELLKRCQWHEKHSAHVTRIALKLFDDLHAWHDLTVADRELLKLACLMHDIGYHISQQKHHKHALYLISNADLKGFTPDEINVMSNVARYHRRSVPKDRHEEFARLKPELKSKIIKMSAFMRVADGLDRSHYQNVQAVKAQVSGNSIDIALVTTSDPELEIWGAKRKSDLFEQLFRRKVRFRQVSELPETDLLADIC
jgi:exopolyphosphatase/guanosine-5'-triphosphate,3'-diphosphate pyrophosphatase